MSTAAERTAQAIADHRSYLKELSSCTPERREEIARDVVATYDLMNYSPLTIWDREDIQLLDKLNSEVSIALRVVPSKSGRT